MRVVVRIACASVYLHWSPAVHTFSQSILFPPFSLPCHPCPQGDVFSFGMTLSELLTFHPPFCGGRGGYRAPNEFYEKIRNGERPRLSLKVGTGHGHESQVVGSVLVRHASGLESCRTSPHSARHWSCDAIHGFYLLSMVWQVQCSPLPSPPLPQMSMSSPILLQRLMVSCWDAQPQHRPSMAQALEEVNKEEFPRLRYELCIKGLTSISTSCVFRVEPQHPSLDIPTSPHQQSIIQPGHPLGPIPSDRVISRAPSRIQSKPLEGAKIDLVHEMDAQPRSELSSECANVTSVSIEKSGQFNSFSGQDGDNPFIKPHTQVWVCGRDYYQPSKKKTSDRKGCYSILTFCDGELGSSVGGDLFAMLIKLLLMLWHRLQLCGVLTASGRGACCSRVPG